VLLCHHTPTLGGECLPDNGEGGACGVGQINPLTLSGGEEVGQQQLMVCITEIKLALMAYGTVSPFYMSSSNHGLWSRYVNACGWGGCSAYYMASDLTIGVKGSALSSYLRCSRQSPHPPYPLCAPPHPPPCAAHRCSVASSACS
jgi:hypothetical protein